MSPGQRSGPCGDTGRAETLAAAKLLDLNTDDTRLIRRPSGSHSEREAALRRAIARTSDPITLRILYAWADDEYVSRAHLRADDREIRRLRRQLREAA